MITRKQRSKLCEAVTCYNTSFFFIKMRALNPMDSCREKVDYKVHGLELKPLLYSIEYLLPSN